MGTKIRIVTTVDSKEAVMMISALVGSGEAFDNHLYLLLTPHSRFNSIDEPTECDLIRKPGQPREKIGTLLPPSEILGEKAAKLGFQVLRLKDMPLFGGIQLAAKPVATVKNFRLGVWGGGCFRVRRVNDSTWQVPIGSGKNSRLYLGNRKGKVAGDIEDVTIQDEDFSFYYPYCGLVNRGCDRPLADEPALGAPVISSAGALSAIIVGLYDNDTLVFPIEELQRDSAINFFTLGEDFPKLKMGSSGISKPKMGGESAN